MTCGGPDDGGAPKAPEGGALPNPGRCCCEGGCCEGGCCVGGPPKPVWGALPVCCCPGIACKEGSEGLGANAVFIRVVRIQKDMTTAIKQCWAHINEGCECVNSLSQLPPWL